MQGTKRIYHKFQINKELLKTGSKGFTEAPEVYLRSEQSDTLPAGKLKGIYFISYVKELDVWSAIDYKNSKDTNPINNNAPTTNSNIPNSKAFICSHTGIRIQDTLGRLITEPTDLKDYYRENWGAKGYKEIDLNIEHNEQITISWETIGNDFPPCGEFIFVIDQIDNCPT